MSNDLSSFDFDITNSKHPYIDCIEELKNNFENNYSKYTEVELPQLQSPVSAFEFSNSNSTCEQSTSSEKESATSTENNSKSEKIPKSRDIYKELFPDTESEEEEGEIKEPEISPSYISTKADTYKKPNFSFERHLRSLYGELAHYTRKREEARNDIANVIKCHNILSERERQILKDGYDEEEETIQQRNKRQKTTESSFASSLIKPTKNFLAPGDRFRFVVNCPSGAASAGACYVEAKVRSITKKGSVEQGSEDEHRIISSPSYPATVDIVFQENPDLHPVFGKKGQRHLLLEGLEERVKFN